MGKGARLKKKAEEKKQSTMWDNLPTGHTMFIPTYKQVKAGATPTVIKNPGRHRGSAAEVMQAETVAEQRYIQDAMDTIEPEDLISLEEEIEAVQGIKIGDHEADVQES